MKKLLYCKFLLAFILIIFIRLTTYAAVAQDVIQVISTDTENNYPNSLTFYITVQSKKPIERITLFYKFQGSISTKSQPVDFDPSISVTTSHTWDTSRMTVAPSTPIYYYWKIVDQDGNMLKTPEKLVYYNDMRFNWQEMSTSEIILRWYDGDKEFGNNIFKIAQKALVQMKEQTNSQLDFPVFILLYANEDDFSSWHYYVHDWVGGQAFPPLGITTQIVPSSANQLWIENVIPHEIAHLFFYQIINADSNHWPTWLDEGLAQYYEFSPNDAALERVSQVARAGNLIPLVLISGDFGSDPDRVRLAYDEAYSVVVYLIETWGYEGLQKLTTNFHDGKGYRDAVEASFGVTWEEFEAGWITWLGTPTTPAPPPTATSTMVYLKAPEGWPTPTKVQPPLSTNTPKILVSTVVPTQAIQYTNVSKSSSVANVYVLEIFGLLVLVVFIVIVYRQAKK